MKFVELYTSGPKHLKGRWDVCAYAAGLKEPPPRDNSEVGVMLRRMVEGLGGLWLPEGYDPPAGPTPSAQLAQLEQVLEGDSDGEAIDWKKIRAVLSATIRSIATGEIRGTPSQVAMVKFVTEKAEAQSVQDEITHKVVVLPTQGTGAEMRIDAKWLERLAQLETKDAETEQSGDSVDAESGSTDSLPE